MEERNGAGEVNGVKKETGGYLLCLTVTVAAGIGLRCLYAAAPHPVLATLAPVNNSPWELGKMVFWPYLAGVLTTRRLRGRQESHAGQCLTLTGMSLAMMLSCCLVRSFCDSCLAVWLTVLAAGLALYAAVLRKKTPGSEWLWYALAILLGIAFVLFSAMPPSGALFTPSSAP